MDELLKILGFVMILVIAHKCVVAWDKAKEKKDQPPS